jgi:hypothetical protein
MAKNKDIILVAGKGTRHIRKSKDINTLSTIVK